jgi:Flp pilus assembly protein CpaB
MTMTRPPAEAPRPGPDDAAPTGPPPTAPPRRRVERVRGLPGGRAVAGGLLVALAGLGTLVAWQQASGAADDAYAVADRPIHPGERLAAEDVRLVPLDLPSGVAGGAFGDPQAVAGRVALGPIGEGELVQAGQVSDPEGAVPSAEVSFALARDRAVDGRLRSGDLVDVFVTYDEGTSAVAERVQVVEVSDGGTTLTSGAELTVTLALVDASARSELIQAVRAGEVTLVRSTHLAAAPPPSTPPPSTPATPFPPTSTPPATADDPLGEGDGDAAEPDEADEPGTTGDAVDQGGEG